jgi:hypothetical protein
MQINIFIPSYIPTIEHQNRLEYLHKFITQITNVHLLDEGINYHFYIFSTNYSEDNYIKNDIVTYINIEQLGITKTREIIKNYIYNHNLDADYCILADDDMCIYSKVLTQLLDENKNLNHLFKCLIEISNENHIGLISFNKWNSFYNDIKVDINELELKTSDSIFCSMNFLNFKFFDYKNIEYKYDDDEAILFAYCYCNDVKCVSFNHSLLESKRALRTTINKTFSFNISLYKKYLRKNFQLKKLFNSFNFAYNNFDKTGDKFTFYNVVCLNILFEKYYRFHIYPNLEKINIKVKL